MKNKKYFQIAIYAFLTFVACFLFYTAVENSQKIGNAIGFWVGVLTPLAIGFVFAYILNFLMKLCEKGLKKLKFLKKPKTVRILAILGAYLMFLAALALVLVLIIPQLISSIDGLVSRYNAGSINQMLLTATDFFRNLAGENAFLLEQINKISPMVDSLVNNLMGMIPGLVPQVLSVLSGLASGVSNLIVGVVISIYLLVDKENLCARMKKITIAVLKKPRGDKVIGFFSEVNDTVGDFLSGKLIDSLIMGFIAFFAFLITGIELPVLEAVILGICNIVPFFGPIVGAIIGGVILLLVNPSQLLIYVIISVVLQQLDGNVIGPKILGKSTGLDALWIIVAILLGGALFGFWGMVLGVPIFAVIYALIRHGVNRKLAEQQMATDTQSYVSYKGELIDLIESNDERKQREGSFWKRFVARFKRKK